MTYRRRATLRRMSDIRQKAQSGQASAPGEAALARFLREDLGIADASPAVDGGRTWHHRGAVWVWRGNGNGPPPKAAWYFVTIDGDAAAAIGNVMHNTRRGFGSVRVTATIGATSWQTSLFPSKETGGYLLPLKASVRKAEELEDGTIASIRLDA